MKVKFRFFKRVVWGSIAILMFIVIGCASPAGPDTPDSVPDTLPGEEQEEREEEPSEKDPESQEPGEKQDNPGDEDGGEEEQEPAEEEEESPAQGELIIRIGAISKSEGIYPDLSGIARYVLDFSGEDGKTAESRTIETGKELTVTLDAGEWEVRAYGIAENIAGKPPQAVIGGAAYVTVPENGTESVLIVPDRPAAGNGEQGYLSWKTGYSGQAAWEALLILSLRVGEDRFIPYKYFDLNAPGMGEQKVSLSAGTYKMESRFLAHGVSTGSTEIVHIYPGLETKSSHTGPAVNAFPAAVEFTSINELKVYLNGLSTNDQNTPYPVKISGVDLASKVNSGDTLKTLYEALGGKYFTLDLRGCTGTQLIAASTASLANRANIVSLILPDSITEVLANGFSGYTSLKSVVMPKVTTINTSAFRYCVLLKTASAPELEIIVNTADTTTTTSGAFSGCIALEAVYFPKLVTLGRYAFYGSGLTAAAFPELRYVGGLAFKRCLALKSLALPNITKIENSAFVETPLESLILGEVPPELGGTGIFTSTSFPQTGVIYVPIGTEDAYKDTDLPNWSSVLKERIKPLSEVTGI
jgi:hypothetical protein